MTQRRSAPAISIGFIGVFLIGLLLGYIVPRIINPPEDDCTADLEECLTSLSYCATELDSIKKELDKWLCSEGDIVIESITKANAKKYMENYKLYWDHKATTAHYLGMNIHCGHFHLINKYLEAPTSTAKHGYRIYMGLKKSSPPFTNNDLIHLLFPVSDGGVADMSATNVLGIDPYPNFELPCPKFCDYSDTPL